MFVGNLISEAGEICLNQIRSVLLEMDSFDESFNFLKLWFPKVPNWRADDWSTAEKGRLSLGMMYGLVAARSESVQSLL